MERNTDKARIVSFSGIMLALNVIILIAINYIQTNTVFLMALASLLSAAVIIEFGLKYGFVYTVASIILSFFILANKMHFILYAMTFGNYGFVKALIEGNVGVRYQMIVKLVYANIIFAILFYGFRLFMDISFKWYYLLIIYEISFVVYDYIFKKAVIYYVDNIRKKIRN